jgi:hypothetical protein
MISFRAHVREDIKDIGDLPNRAGYEFKGVSVLIHF